MKPSREDVYQAQFTLLSTLTLFNTITRECKERERFEVGEQPVLMQYEMDEDFNWDASPANFQEWECWLLIGCLTNPGT
ncbi:MAG: hypothetical protein ACREMY_31665, partial [bacterium]